MEAMGFQLLIKLQYPLFTASPIALGLFVSIGATSAEGMLFGWKVFLFPSFGGVRGGLNKFNKEQNVEECPSSSSG